MRRSLIIGTAIGAVLTLGGSAMAYSLPPNPDTCQGLTGNAYVDCRYSELDDKYRGLLPSTSPTPSASATPTPSATPTTPSSTPTPTATPTPSVTQPANVSRLRVAHSSKFLGFNSSGQSIQVPTGAALEFVQVGSAAWRQIKDVASGRCLSVEAVRESRPVLATCSNTDTRQRWDLPTSSSQYVGPTGTNLTLDVANASTADNAVVNLWTKYSAANQRWTVDGSTTTTPTATPSSTPSQTNSTSPSGEAMPANAPAGWTRVFSEDFTANVARGSWPGSYDARWYGYDCSVWGDPDGCDTSKVGDYDRRAVVSANNGVMNYFVHTGSDGLPKVAAEGPKINGADNNQLYGRYTVRWRADRMPLYKSAWLLWPASNTWNEGEIDYPEGEFDANIEAFNHCPGDPARNCAHYDSGVGMSSGWHTSTIEWRPGSIDFILDGRSIGRTTTNIPNTPFRWVLQTETNLDGVKPAASTQGNVQIDWVTIERLN